LLDVFERLFPWAGSSVSIIPTSVRRNPLGNDAWRS